jgi:hypothetical protein
MFLKGTMSRWHSAAHLEQALHASCSSAMVVVTPNCGPIAAIACAPTWLSVSWSQVTPGGWTLPGLAFDNASASICPGILVGQCADTCITNTCLWCPQAHKFCHNFIPHRVPHFICQSWLFYCGNYTVNPLYTAQLSIEIYMGESSSFPICHTARNLAHWVHCP